MVLTNFECWAHGGSGDGSFYVDTVNERRNAPTVDLFNPNALQEYSDHSYNNPPKIVSHLSSNGYYGFAPVCRAVASSDDVKIGEQQQKESIQMMDVEQQCSSNISIHIPSSPQAANSPVAGNVDKFSNGSLGRRKRFFVEDDNFQMQRRNAKKCRFDQQREQYIAHSNGSCPSTYAPTIMFPKSMDHDEFPVTLNPTNDIHRAAPCDNLSFAAVNQNFAINSSADASTNKKRSYNKNTLPDLVCSNPFIPSFIPNTPHISKTTQEFKSPFVARNNEISNTKEYEKELKYLSADDSLQSKSETYPANGNILCDDARIDHTRDDQLEKLFLLTHGGGDHHLWRHLLGNNSCEDI